ncbi:hypothetical protein SAMN05661008_00328 [Alkalithermobacter thermoalcaliphilus JW-YL-7 = DSM 7308]|uniref:XkdN-like protein n=1 Tax=Alkalithermobacter thermoalcaliphilus JW-YL-7 = DSM 7308 TaxID=1121328 RepID=A0A150FPI7_CLOPD|nr:hypothetical protein JWYL7_0561 [[Clostridium] paradoxum JW-YL-7 = DSM 7308]SHK49919.1 hypothetical protein SAMN05661008_00328 [[Clostridium] paradoxum JW-YL-7 = DSM 7308]
MTKVSRKQVLDKINKRKERYFVEEWDGEVLIKGLTLGEKMQIPNIAKKFEDGDKKVAIDMAKFVVKCVLDVETEEPLFELSDVEALANDDTGAVEKVFNKIMAVSGYGTEVQETIEKN